MGKTVTFDFTTHNPTTGNVSDADSLPTCEVFENVNDTAILTPTVSKRVSKTGNYNVSFAVTEANGFEIGNTYNIIVTAIVDGVTAKARIDAFLLMPASSASFML